MSIKIDWYKLAWKYGFREPSQLFTDMRQKGMSYEDMAYELNCARFMVRYKCYELLALGKLKPEDIKMKPEMADHIIRNMNKSYPYLARKLRHLGRKL